MPSSKPALTPSGSTAAARRRSAATSDETDAVAIRIFHVHLAVTPRLVGRLKIDVDMSSEQFLIQLINVVHEQLHDTAGDAVPGKRRDVQPRIDARQTHVARVRLGLINAVGEMPAEAQPVAIELLRRSRATYMEDRDR